MHLFCLVEGLDVVAALPGCLLGWLSALRKAPATGLDV